LVFIGIAIIIAGAIIGLTLEKVAEAIQEVSFQINILVSAIRDKK
jgi:hypothetical protein